MFYYFPYHAVGFDDETWEAMPRVERVIVRDWYLNGRDRRQTTTYGEYDTPFQVGKVERKYNLHQRPFLRIQTADFHLA